MMLQIILASVTAVCALGQRCASNSAIHDFAFGDLSVTVVTDGFLNSGKPEESNSFVASALAVRRSYEANFVSVDPLLAPQNVALVSNRTHRVIIDTGAINLKQVFGEFCGRLQDNLKAAEIDPHGIDAVVITHGHGDHVGGLLTADGKRAFENAELFISDVEYNFWHQPEEIVFRNLPNLDPEVKVLFRQLFLSQLAPYEAAGKLNLIKAGDDVYPWLTTVSTPGHAVGHMSVMATSQDKSLFISGDMVISKSDNIQNPDWPTASAANPEQDIATRFRMLDELAANKTLMIVYHELFPGVGHVVPVGSIFDWIPSRDMGLASGVKKQCTT